METADQTLSRPHAVAGKRTLIIIDEMVKEITQHTIDIEAAARAVKLANGDENAPAGALAALDKPPSFGLAAAFGVCSVSQQRLGVHLHGWRSHSPHRLRQQSAD
jgi:hypothetical protein